MARERSPQAGESRVCKVLLGRADLLAELVELMAKHSNGDIRAAAAAHPNLSLASLYDLARDGEDGVSGAARQRLAELRAQGVDVNAGRGWFKRLFG